MNTDKKIAILTGATGGLGYAFLKELCKERYSEIWAIGRNTKRLEELVEEFGNTVIPLNMDLTKSEDFKRLCETLKEQSPQIDLLINNAGIAQMKPSKDLTAEEIQKTVDINCKAPAILINICLPYMQKASKIINVCSASAFQPVVPRTCFARKSGKNRPCGCKKRKRRFGLLGIR